MIRMNGYRTHLDLRYGWGIETLFQELTVTLNCEINTLGYPKAALFGFCVALMAYNVMSLVKAALRAEHGHEKVQADVSGFHLTKEVSRGNREVERLSGR